MSISAIASTTIGDARYTDREATGGTGGRRSLSREEQQQVTELMRRDTEVRAHEAAHTAAGGAYIRGGPNYEYETGPDGKRYAVGGEVSIDSSPVSGNPQATITKMQTVRRAALAPAQPSGQDQTVAAQAGANEAKARQELAKQRLAEASGAAEATNQSAASAKPPGGSRPPEAASATSAYTRNSTTASTKEPAHPASGHYFPINITA